MGGQPFRLGTLTLDILAGGRYWHQSVTVSADLTANVNLGGLEVEAGRVFARSGSVNWVDPFIGAESGNRLLLART